MKQESFKSKHPIAHKLVVVAVIAAEITVGALIVPRLADKFSGRMIKNSASIEIPDEGPEIVRNDDAEER